MQVDFTERKWYENSFSEDSYLNNYKILSQL